MDSRRSPIDETTLREYYPQERTRRLGSRRARVAPEGSAPAGRIVLGRYQLGDRLGAGGFGTVWRAQDLLLGREVAVKRIELGEGDDADRAGREATASARLSHPAIVSLYEACEADGAFYLISELVEGDTLARLIADDALTDEEVLVIASALAGALDHAHGRGVVHRDIKPQNVLVPRRPSGPAGAAKLADFGGASLAGEDALTRTGDVMGTLAYMAPEQLEGAEVGEKADLYSLALVVYEALTGVNPVRGPTPAATARQIGRRIAPLGGRRRELPANLAEAIDIALEPDPSDRGTLADLAADIDDALAAGLVPRRRALLPTARISRRRARVPEVLAPVEPREYEDEDEDTDVAPLPATAPSARRTALPRSIWLGLVLAACGWQAATGRPGLALVMLAALLPVLAFPARDSSRRLGASWLLCALAPALGLVGLAAAFPAAAGQAGRGRERAALGALGCWWLVLAEPLAARTLWFGIEPSSPPRAVWEASVSSASRHVLSPVLTLAVLGCVAVWGLAAAVLPLLVRGRSAVADLLAAGAWAAVVVVGTRAVTSAGGHAHALDPRGLIAGAVLGAGVAVAARALRGPV